MSFKPANTAAAAGFIDPASIFNMVQSLQNSRRRAGLTSGTIGSGSGAAGTNPASSDRFQSFLSVMSRRPERII